TSSYTRSTDPAGTITFSFTNNSSLAGAIEFAVSYAGNAAYLAAEWSKTITVHTQANPEGLGSVASLSGASTGSITGTSSLQQYTNSAVSSINGSTRWTNVPGSEITGLGAATYAVRYKARAEGDSVLYAASDAVNVTVEAGVYTVTPDTGNSEVSWQPASPVAVVRLGTASFTALPSPEYIITGVALSRPSSGSIAYNPATGAITVTKVNANQTITVTTKRISKPVVTIVPQNVREQNGVLWSATPDTGFALSVTDEYYGLTSLTASINGTPVLEEAFSEDKAPKSYVLNTQSYAALAGAESFEVTVQATNAIGQTTLSSLLVKADTTLPTIEVAGNPTASVHSAILSIQASAGPSGIAEVSVEGTGDITGAISGLLTFPQANYTVNQNGSYTFTVKNGAGAVATRQVTVLTIVGVSTRFTLTPAFRIDETKVIKTEAIFTDVKTELLDEYGQPVEGAKISFSIVTAAPGTRYTDADGKAQYGSSYTEGSYTLSARFDGGFINGLYYLPSQDSKEIEVKEQAEPLIYDSQVFASKAGEKNGKILGVNENMEYIEWIPTIGVNQQLHPVTGSTVTGLAPTIYSIRYREYAVGNTLYLASPYYIFSLPRAEWTVAADSSVAHVLWGPETSSVDVAPGGTAYFTVAAENGHKITGVSVNRPGYVGNVSYDNQTGKITITRITSNVTLFVTTEKTAAETPASSSPAAESSSSSATASSTSGSSSQAGAASSASSAPSSSAALLAAGESESSGSGVAASQNGAGSSSSEAAAEASLSDAAVPQAQLPGKQWPVLPIALIAVVLAGLALLLYLRKRKAHQEK
ncbi:MAG: hypothetical protein ACK5L3_02850, partial [Oscillospiraceae bacterium]